MYIMMVGMPPTIPDGEVIKGELKSKKKAMKIAITDILLFEFILSNYLDSITHLVILCLTCTSRVSDALRQLLHLLRSLWRKPRNHY